MILEDAVPKMLLTPVLYVQKFGRAHKYFANGYTQKPAGHSGIFSSFNNIPTHGRLGERSGLEISL